MKKHLIIIAVLVLGVSGITQVFAATAAPASSAKGAKVLQAQLLKIKKRQAATKARIQRNIQTAKNEVRVTKKKRAVELRRRASVKARAAAPIKP